MIDMGRAMIYLTLPVKFRSRKKLPVKPQARDRALSMISLRVYGVSLWQDGRVRNKREYGRGHAVLTSEGRRCQPHCRRHLRGVAHY